MLGYMFINGAAQYVPIFLCMVIQNLSPLMVALLQYFMLGIEVCACELVNIAFIGVISSVLVLQGGVSGADQSYALGVALAVLSVIAFTGTYIFPKQTEYISTHTYLLLG